MSEYRRCEICHSALLSYGVSYCLLLDDTQSLMLWFLLTLFGGEELTDQFCLKCKLLYINLFMFLLLAISRSSSIAVVVMELEMCEVKIQLRCYCSFCAKCGYWWLLEYDQMIHDPFRFVRDCHFHFAIFIHPFPSCLFGYPQHFISHLS